MATQDFDSLDTETRRRILDATLADAVAITEGRQPDKETDHDHERVR
jgi:hypothetical protein